MFLLDTIDGQPIRHDDPMFALMSEATSAGLRFHAYAARPDASPEIAVGLLNDWEAARDKWTDAFVDEFDNGGNSIVAINDAASNSGEAP